MKTDLDAFKAGKPGFYTGIPAEIYHALDAVSASKLKTLAEKSPAHLKAEMDRGREEIRAFVIGSATHTGVLEPQLFKDKYAIQPDFGDCRKKDNAAARDAWRAENEGKVFLSDEEAADIRGMYMGVKRCKGALQLIQMRGDTECSLVWIDTDTGLLCKSRFDRLVTDADGNKIIIDLKTTIDASEDGFGREAAKYRYHLQAAMYLNAAANVLNTTRVKFVFVAVEKKYPYEAAFYDVTQAQYMSASRKLERLMGVYAECKLTDTWPGYGNEIKPLKLPAWVTESDEEVVLSIGGEDLNL